MSWRVHAATLFSWMIHWGVAEKYNVAVHIESPWLLMIVASFLNQLSAVDVLCDLMMKASFYS